MRKLLTLALLLYDIIASATRLSNYEYDEMGADIAKGRHPLEDKRREWRRKSNLKEMDHNDWEERIRRHDYDNRYFDDMEKKILDKTMVQERIVGRDRMMMPDRGRRPERPRERESELNYRRRYEDVDKPHAVFAGAMSAEADHAPTYKEKEPEKKPLAASCDRPHERYEPCFAGCATVSCDNPRDRLRPCYPFCEPGCVCVPPFVRDDRTHKCVMPEDCTKGLKGIPDLGDDAS
ncbi:trypsin inhibitor like cysteine rich domain-containing protein [Phthorimaea operculella]|nr:trypsin inhibitor like cysteine rich domain-containing protein [Phthorimaea operculella]